jgi:ADP-heptose:LPS heptosyltransferase
MRELKRPSGFKPIPRDLKRVLVIKLSALGDVVQATASMKAIRAHHPDAHITLLTTAPFVGFLEGCPYVDVMIGDGRPEGTSALLELAGTLRRGRFQAVYDLQTSGRTSRYLHFLRPFVPRWSGTAAGCSHPHANMNRLRLHTLDRLAEQLWFAGIGEDQPPAIGKAPLPDLGWIVPSAQNRGLRTDPAHFDIAGPFVMLVPGAAPHRPVKRWPADRYAQLARQIADAGLTPVVVGAAAEAEAGAIIAGAEPRARNLVARTNLHQIAGLAAKAHFVVGNDTGPTHIAAAMGAGVVVLFSGDSDPDLCAPRGRVTTLRAKSLSQVSVEDVAQVLQTHGVFAAAETQGGKQRRTGS